MSAHVPRLSSDDRAALRSKLGLPADRPIVLSVAAINYSHKRIDYLINEVASIKTPRPFLLVAGEVEEETPRLRELAVTQLGSDGFSFRRVPADAVAGLYQASDVFVLASLYETQGRALVEAASFGIPCIAHDSPIMRFALGPPGLYLDLSVPGGLAARLADVLSRPQTRSEAEARHRHVHERFSWDRLAPRYVDLLRSLALANKTVSSTTGE